MVLGGKETDVALHQLDSSGRIVEHDTLHTDVAVFAFVDHPGIGERLAALPQLHHARIAGGRHRAGAEIRSAQHRVLGEVAEGGFCLRQLKAVLHERLRGRIELAHHDRITAAARKMQQAMLQRGRAFRALPHPVLVLLRRQLIQVEQDVPVGRRCGVGRDAGAPPDSLGVLRVLPEVENKLMVEVTVGNAVGRIHHPENRVVVLLIARISLQSRGGPGVLRPHPFQGLCAVNVFEPQIRIGGRAVFLMLPVHAVRSHRAVRCHRRPADRDRRNDSDDHHSSPSIQTHGCSQDSVGTSLGTGNDRR